MNNDDFLISQLISETYDEAPQKEQPNDVCDLRNYFEKKLNEVEFISVKQYLSQNSLRAQSVKYIENIKCFRVVLNNHVLDFPSNWSIFNDLSKENLIYLESKNDQDFLIDIFSELTGEQTNLAMIKHDSQISMVFVPEDLAKEHLKWFRGFFEKQNQNQKLDTSEEAA
jgi:hypothetical protein